MDARELFIELADIRRPNCLRHPGRLVAWKLQYVLVSPHNCIIPMSSGAHY